MSNWADRAKVHFSHECPAATPITGETLLLGVLGATAGTFCEKQQITPLAWLRDFIGADTVPLTAIRQAAKGDGIDWRAVLKLRDDYIIVLQSMDRIYWKFARFEW